ncbi:MAG: hypothetical protein COY40_03930 [Alphaproteobacteria bacterium CG_4_10_14_0_8_um_filter_53_9]|nr:MAG: hypothetical protein COY40_03930 [Alphaproteobacteria bacterium CG_4_10_14_0_8_um_filter_53_9]
MLFGFFPLIYRNLLSWRPYAPVYYLRLFEVPVQIYGFGLGLALMATQLPVDNYTQYIFPGMLVWMFWLTIIIDATYITFMKAFGQRLWGAILATPIKLTTILLADALVALVKGTTLYILFYPIGIWLDAIPSSAGYALAIFPMAVYMLMVTSLGHFLCSLARHEYDFDYIWPVFVGPMFVFSGIFYPLTSLPLWAQNLSTLFPMTHAIAAVRPLILGTAEMSVVVSHTAVLAGMAVVFFILSHHFFKKRLFE